MPWQSSCLLLVNEFGGTLFTIAKDVKLQIEFNPAPDGEKSKLIEHADTGQSLTMNERTVNFRFVSAVAKFGMRLRNSDFKQHSSFNKASAMANNALGKDGPRLQVRIPAAVTG